MLEKIVAELGKVAFARMITPLHRVPLFQGEIVGFDTEYDSKTARFLSYQLGYNGHGVMVTGSISVDSLAGSCLDLIGFHPGEIMLISYWSLAELQFLPVRTESFNWKEFGLGSFDCSFHSKRHNLTLHIFDLARFFDRQSLANVAKTFGLRKLDYERHKISRRDLQRADFKEYAINDAIITEQICRSLRNEYLGRGVDILDTRTPANTAATVFRLEQVREPFRNDNSPARLAGMRSAWGGRAEALERGYFSSLHEYDLASAYPNAALAIKRFPLGPDWRELSTLARSDNKHGFAKIRFRFDPSERYPCLLVAGKYAQIYPIEGETWATLPEITLARAIGCRCVLIEGWTYNSGTLALRDFLQGVVEARKTAEGAKRVALKLLANSLIGKLAQRTHTVDIDKMAKTAKEIGCSIEELFSLSWDEQAALGIEPRISVGALFMPEWNALITGYVRAQISEMVAATEAVYVATDAVWTRTKLHSVPPGYTHTRSGPGVVARTRLGMILDDKAYPHIAHHSIWSRDIAKRLLRNIDKPLRYVTKRPIKVREALREGLKIGKWVTEWRNADARWDNKRILEADGSTRPWKSVTEYEAAITAALKAQRKKNARRSAN